MSALVAATPKRRGLVAANKEPTAPALLEFQSPSAALIAARPIGMARGVAWTVSALVASCITAAALIPIDKVISAQGRVVSQSPTIVIQPLDTAIVRSIEVREGQQVHAGDLLAQLDPTFAAADLGSLQQQVDSLLAEVNRLKAEAEGKPYVAAANDPSTQLQAAIYAQRAAERNFKLENYAQKISSLETQIARDLSVANSYRQRLAVASDVESMRNELQRMQVGSKLNSLAAADNRLEIARYLQVAQDSAQAEKRDLAAMVAERDAYDQDWHATVLQNLTEQGRKLSDAQEQFKKAKLRRQLVELRAPQDATVMSVAKVSVGSVLQTGAQFLTLVPSNAPLEVEASVAGSDAGFVHVGDEVTVKFDTFPFTQYGSAEGKVRVVSPDSYTQNDQGGGGGQMTSTQQDTGPGGRTWYKARVTLDEIKLHDTPTGFQVQPGMPVTADIKVGQRTILTYMLGRVLPVAMDGMREP